MQETATAVIERKKSQFQLVEIWKALKEAAF